MVKMERVAEFFQKESSNFWKSCSSSDHSPEKSMELSEMVNSFIERDYNMERYDLETQEEDKENVESDDIDDSCDSDTENKLRNFLFGSWENESEREEKERIEVEAEQAFKLVGVGSLDGFKRQLMANLRKKGFDAGLCKSKWKNSESFPSGNHEYVDVNINGNQYIVEILLAGEFKIARPTRKYTSLLNIFPTIFVGKLGELQQIVKLMCSAMKQSMKSKGMHLPPWRRNNHMQAKWSASHTLRTVSVLQVSFPEKLKVLPVMAFHCREGFGRDDGVKVWKNFCT